jgi:hypothetical protein
LLGNRSVRNILIFPSSFEHFDEVFAGFFPGWNTVRRRRNKRGVKMAVKSVEEVSQQGWPGQAP